MIRSLNVCRIPYMEYEAAFALQRRCVESLRQSGEDSGLLILIEHPPVLTIGRSGTDANIIVPRERLEREGVAVYESNRGGDITYHGPGQIVGYPIIPLSFHGKDIHRYMRTLEAILMDTLSDYDIPSSRKEGYTGVWTPKGKIVSIGVAVRHWITYHGFALNVAPDMAHFGLIHPCGLVGVQMACMRDFLGSAPERSGVEDAIVSHFCQAFGFGKTEAVPPEALNEVMT